MGQVVPKYRSKIRGGTVNFRIIRELPDHRAAVMGWSPVQRRCKARGPLTGCCFGCKTGLRHSRHCGQQTLRVFVTWGC
jgi:hypothetical protein